MNSYIPSNDIKMLVNNKLLINDKHIVDGLLYEIEDLWIYQFEPFSEYGVEEEKDCVNDIAVFLKSKLKTTYNRLYATSSHFHNDEGVWIIQFDLVKQAK
jgi:hypothetical protein